ncbi:MAG: hypothetical protein KJ065_13440 [Anaerolineae bacterium]|nr:hypothetical protein [Anaerolineae bacterium]
MREKGPGDEGKKSFHEFANSTERQVNPDTVGRALAQAGIERKRAKQRINSPDADYVGKKSDATG